MANSTQIQALIEQSSQQSVQDIPKGEMSNVWVVNWLSYAGLALPPWWSPSRDVSLRDFWKKSDHLSGALYTMEAKMKAIPFKVVPRSLSSKADIRQSQLITDILWSVSEFGKGWTSFFGKFVEDLLSQDNGAFAEIIGQGSKSGPIIGQPLSVANLDSSKCQRTGNSTYPVIYYDTDGQVYRLHASRVMFESQMPSPISEMYGVGFSAISRCVGVAQTLVDILIYKQEKLGSRPHRSIIITKGGLDPHDVQTAFELAENNMDSRGLSRYSKVVVGGSSSIPDAGLDVVELSKMPDGFDEQTSITMGMAAIALAFGVDARELFPATGGAATRADAMLSHLKQRGKGPGEILQITEQLFNYKFIPTNMTMMFDFQDDAEDRQRAEIRSIRANRRVQDMSTGSLTDRVLREQMVEDGEITQDQFDRMEIEDGRLPNGMPITSLFYRKDAKLRTMLQLTGLPEPLDIKGNNTDKALKAIDEKKRNVLEVIATSRDDDFDGIEMARQAYYALINLELQYVEKKEEEQALQNGIVTPVAKPGAKKTEKTYVDPRVRNTNPGRPTTDDANPQSAASSKVNDLPDEDREENVDR